MISSNCESIIASGRKLRNLNSSEQCCALSYRVVVVLCAILSSSQAFPLEKFGPQPERILFAVEGPRSVSGAGHRRHTSGRSPGAEVIRAIEGQDVVLECEAASRNGPSIHWLNQGKRIVQAGEKVTDDFEFDVTEEMSISTGSTRSRLFLDCVSPLQAGEYICVADTPTSRNITVRHLVVEEIEPERRLSALRSIKRSWKGRSSNCEKKSNDNVGARIYEWTTRRLVEESSDVRLVCRASGSPLPKISWLDRNKKPITSADAQYQILDNGDLVIRKTTFNENMGLYHCIADNGFGTNAVSTFVYPAGKDSNGPAVKYN